LRNWLKCPDKILKDTRRIFSGVKTVGWRIIILWNLSLTSGTLEKTVDTHPMEIASSLEVLILILVGLDFWDLGLTLKVTSKMSLNPYSGGTWFLRIDIDQ